MKNQDATKATGYYSFATGPDGLCCFATKKAAVNAAKHAEGRGAIKIYSPSGIHVETVWSVNPEPYWLD